MAFTLIGSQLGMNSNAVAYTGLTGALMTFVSGNFGSVSRAVAMLLVSANGVDFVPAGGTACREASTFRFYLATGAYIKVIVRGGDAATSINVVVADAGTGLPGFDAPVFTGSKKVVYSDGLSAIF